VNDPIAILKKDHREAAALLKELAASKPGARRRKTATKLDQALSSHMRIEEEFVYPLVATVVGRKEAKEAGIEHGLARDGLSKLVALIDEPGFGATVAMLTAGIKHHVKEEEQDVFPDLKRGLDRETLAKLGDDVAAAKKPKRTSRS
jgi:iron-sulfur cluster repair protein YtfE (RIC family)